MRGKTSQIWMPGTLVLIGLNSPRISPGASVLMSHMSWCGGPPPRKMLMTALCGADVSRPGFGAEDVGQVKAVAPKAKVPILRKLRRVMPSQ